MIDKIDNILEFASVQEVVIPEIVNQRIEKTLTYKKRKKKSILNIIKNIIIAVISLVTVSVSGFAVYAKVTGLTENLPNFDWIGIKFNPKLNDYMNIVDEPKVSFDKTSVTLLSTVCSEYVTLLEFDVKLSDEDVEYLRLGKSLLMQEDYESVEKNINTMVVTRYINSLEDKELFDSIEKDIDGRVIIEKIPQDIVDKAKEYIEEEEKQELEELKEKAKANGMTLEQFLDERVYYRTYRQKLKEAYKEIETWDEFINVATIVFNVKEATNNFWSFKAKDGKKYSLNWTSIVLNGEEQYVKHIDTTEKIADNEYRVSILLLIPDEIVNDEEFTIDINNIVVCNKGIPKNNSDVNGVSSLNTENNERVVLVDDNYQVTLNKQDVLKDSKKIENASLKSEFKNITQSIEKITITPFQTIIKSKTIITGINKDTPYYDTDEINWPMWIEYNVTDEQGNELECQGFEVKRVLTKTNGDKEEWAVGDINTSSRFKDATIEYTEYYMVENNNSNKLFIEPKYRVQSNPRIEDNWGSGEHEQLMPAIEVDLE